MQTIEETVGMAKSWIKKQEDFFAKPDNDYPNKRVEVRDRGKEEGTLIRRTLRYGAAGKFANLHLEEWLLPISWGEAMSRAKEQLVAKPLLLAILPEEVSETITDFSPEGTVLELQTSGNYPQVVSEGAKQGTGAVKTGFGLLAIAGIVLIGYMAFKK